ncbi:hypothetical protein MPH_11111 [Macrophomina phaseolina MS6]|uniref:Uncharacterized protein n=2 Tax=Macrophomina phaseolina TaxID=35725 RepID=K2RAT9_MACPH|nr:hypothetical protein MPH_11111 [Macrophomina phaseolina MS6]KAH7057281.1 hypothetical protein B0J12DRAFT_783683 [Macrophomina phaseolina]
MLFSIISFATAVLATPLQLQGLDLYKRQQNTCGNNARELTSDSLGPTTVTNLIVQGTREDFTISFDLRNENTGIDTTCSAQLSISSTDRWIQCAQANTGANAQFRYCAVCPERGVRYSSYGNVNYDVPCQSASQKEKRGILDSRQAAGAVRCQAQGGIPVTVTNVGTDPQPPQ